MERRTITAVTVNTSGWDQMVITDEHFAELGPSIQDLVLHLEMRNTTATFECRVVLQRKLLDGDWGPVGVTIGAADLVMPVQVPTVDGYAPLAVYSDRTRLGGAQIRLLLQWHATTGGTLGAKSELTIGVALRFFAS